MKRICVIAALAVSALLAFVPAALAGNAHLRNNVRPNPAFVDNGLTLTGTAAYAGLGNFDTLQTLDATGNPTSSCTNPAGATQPPGQNPAEADVSGSTAVPKGDIKNGNVTIATVTNAPTSPIPGAPDCPNPQWTEAITDMAFTSATIKLFQDANADGDFLDAGELVLTVNCTFSPPTSNGIVPASGYSCTSS